MSKNTTNGDAEIRSRVDLVAAASELVPVLREHRAEGESLRRLADGTMAALRESGMLRLASPRRHGGHGAGLRTSLEVTAQLARGDASASWIVAVVTGGAYAVGQLDRQGREEVWGDNRDAVIVGSLNLSGTGYRAEDGGLVVSGQWPWASGADAADWATLGVSVLSPEGIPVDAAIAVIPAARLSIADTWHVAGMAGTGSKSLAAEQVHVPPQLVLSLAGVRDGRYAQRWPDEPYLRTPVSSLAGLPLTGPMIGMARAALGLTLDTAGRKPMSLTTYRRIADSPSAQLALADAAAFLDSAELHAYRAADDADRAAWQGRPLTNIERARVRMDTGTAAARCRDAVDALLSVAGAGAFALANPLQQIWRDLGAASRHAACNLNLAREMYGRALLDITEETSLLR